MKEINYWKVAPGSDGFLWPEHKINGCIAVGWEFKNLTRFKYKESLEEASMRLYGYIRRTMIKFYLEVNKGDRVIACSGRNVYGIGTVSGNYRFNDDLTYKHSYPVDWEITFWDPVDIDETRLSENLKKKLSGQPTLIPLQKREWEDIYKIISKLITPYKNLDSWQGHTFSPLYEIEVIMIFSKLMESLKMKTVCVSDSFPDAELLVRRGNKWINVSAEFARNSIDFERHGHDPDDCDMIICWKHNWSDIPSDMKIIELRKVLEKILKSNKY